MKHCLLGFVLGVVPMVAGALDAEFDLDGNQVNQEDFESMAEDITAVLNYKALGPAEPLGLVGFGIGAFASYVATEDDGPWRRVTNDSVDEIGMVGIAAQKGLPLGLDVGLSYAYIPGADADVIGGEVRYALLDGGLAQPAVALRGTYTVLTGVDDFDFDAYGLDISISKGFGPLTPYAGAGYVWSRYEIDESVQGLQDTDVDESRIFIGLRLSLLFGITPEYERIGDRDVFNLRAGFTF